MKKVAKSYKKGQKVTMLFHGFGLVSKEKHEILDVKGDVITLGTDEDVNKCKKFHTKSGACLNDTVDFGCYRTLKLD